MARKKAKAQKDKALNVRCEEPDLARWKEAAEKERMPLNVWVRRVLHCEADRILASDDSTGSGIDVEALDSLLTAIRRQVLDGK